MATATLLQKDIRPLQQELLRNLESQDHQPDSEFGLTRDSGVVATTLQYLQPPSAAPESVPELPSTVPDSQFQSNVESEQPAVPHATAPRKKMTSQVSDGATQELSPSHYDEILSRSRSEQHLQLQEEMHDPDEDDGHQSDEEDEHGETQHEGDAGFVDLMSSANSPKADDGDEADNDHQFARQEPEQVQEQEDSEPFEVNFSPTQSHQALSQFPESQRFKTPATAGKKRWSSGELVDSPTLPRNPIPLLRGGDNSASAMRASQLFAATQANTSPFLSKLNGDLHSDRPSPNINVEPRPATAVSSSPMRLISTIERSARAGTEPLDHYVSSKESQARREEIYRRELENRARSLDSDEDEFAIEENSWDIKNRKERQRSLHMKTLLSSPSSVITSPRNRPAASRPSPIHGPPPKSSANSQIVKRPRNTPVSNPQGLPRELQVTESEEETEEEDNTGPTSSASNREVIPLGEEDKENFSDRPIQVPETTGIRLQRIVNEPASQVQETPLMRRGRQLSRDRSPRPLSSSQPVAVADSQPDRSGKRPAVTQVLRSSAAEEGLDFVPQSPESSPRPTAQLDRQVTPTSIVINDGEEAAENKEASAKPVVQSSRLKLPQLPEGTVPETSSNELQPQSSIDCGLQLQNGETESRSDFETAATHQENSTPIVLQPPIAELSSQPVSITPPGRKRKRISDIQAEPSPLKSQPSFDASAALDLEATFLDPPSTTKRRKIGIGRTRESLRIDSLGSVIETTTPKSDREIAEGLDVEDKAGGGMEQEPLAAASTEPLHPVSAPLTRPRRTRLPTAKALDARTTRLVATAPVSRTSQYDLPESPQPKFTSRSKHSARLKRKALDAIEPPAKVAPVTSKRRKLTRNTAMLVTPPPNVVEEEKEKESMHLAIQEMELPASAVQEQYDITNHHMENVDIAPNMVFAVFNGGSRTYYPALCLGHPHAEPNRYTIQWQGYAPEIVDESGVRSLDLRIDDQVKIDLEGFPKVSYVIKGFKDLIEEKDLDSSSIITDTRGYQTLLVAPKQRKSLPADMSTKTVQEVPVSRIYLDSNMWGRMKDRVYEYQPVESSGTSTPIDQSSMPATPISRSRRGTAPMVTVPTSQAIRSTGGLFEDMVFAISYDKDKRRHALSKLIHKNGGIIMDSFWDLFERDTVQLKPQFNNLKFTALLTNQHTRKEKYLQALTLGLPCLSGTWIEASLDANKPADWSPYLLAAGHSTELEGAVKSRILQLPPSLQSLKTEDQIAARSKIFDGSRVLVVKGKGKAAENYGKYLSIIRALGPSQIDVEPKLQNAKTIVSSAAKTDQPVDYVFVDDGDLQTAQDLFSVDDKGETVGAPNDQPRGKAKKSRTSRTQAEVDNAIADGSQDLKVKIVCNEDIVQSLILGKLWIGSSRR